MTLLRYLRSLGLKPVAAGNLKGMIDRYRTPETQREFAAKYNQDAAKVTSFADGTKLSMEACILANATGFTVGQRGMFGPKCAHVREIPKLLPLDQLRADGLVDYALGAEPHTGAFVIVYEENPRKQKELAYYKLGDGPCYVFYTPYHLPHIQIASTIARATLFGDPTVTPLGGPTCEVITVAKRNLEAGEALDGVGGFMAYGLIEKASISAKQNLLPMGISEGCRLLRNIPKDQPITYADIELPQGRLCDQLRAEQECHFTRETPEEERIKKKS
jgi:predicted homoserine dehydrogenase-like protein